MKFETKGRGGDTKLKLGGLELKVSDGGGRTMVAADGTGKFLKNWPSEMA